MADFVLAAFLGLLIVYGAYSFWVRLDSRYPIVAGLVLLVLTALASGIGAFEAAATLAVYVFFLLLGGVILLLADQLRERWAARLARADGAKPSAHPGEPPDQRDRAA